MELPSQLPQLHEPYSYFACITQGSALLLATQILPQMGEADVPKV